MILRDWRPRVPKKSKKQIKKEQASQLKEIMDILLEFFENDTLMVALWLDTKNELFGGIRPLDLMRINKVHKVYNFVKDAKENLDAFNKG